MANFQYSYVVYSDRISTKKTLIPKIYLISNSSSFSILLQTIFIKKN